MKNKKFYTLTKLSLLLAVASIAIPSTTFATFTCWNNTTINRYNWDMYKPVFQQMLIPEDHNPQDHNPKSHTPKRYNPAHHKPHRLQPQTAPQRKGITSRGGKRWHRVAENPQYESSPKRRRVNRKGERSEPVEKVECELCTHSFSSNEIVELSCCKNKNGDGQKVCKTCLERLHNPKETVQDPLRDISFDHPQDCLYAQGANPMEKAKTRVYETATPQSQPSWTWRKIGQYWYFLKDNRYWRYTGTNASYNAANAVFWRYICVTELQCRCPFCRGTIETH